MLGGEKKSCFSLHICVSSISVVALLMKTFIIYIYFFLVINAHKERKINNISVYVWKKSYEIEERKECSRGRKIVFKNLIYYYILVYINQMSEFCSKYLII